MAIPSIKYLHPSMSGSFINGDGTATASERPKHMRKLRLAHARVGRELSLA